MSGRMIESSTSESIEEEPEETESALLGSSDELNEQQAETSYNEDMAHPGQCGNNVMEEHQVEPIKEEAQERDSSKSSRTGELQTAELNANDTETDKHHAESESVKLKSQSLKELRVKLGDGGIIEDHSTETNLVKSKQTVSEKLLVECRKKTPDIDTIKGYLEDEDCDVNIREDDDFKWSPIMWACENKHFEIAKLILKHQPQVNIEDKKKWSPLVLASRAGDLEVVQGVVALGAVIDKPTNKKWTPLMWASQEGHADVAKFLLEKGAFVDCQDENGWTPLMQASQEGHVNVINVLLDHNAKVNHQSHTTWCALMAAAKNKHSEVVVTLLKRGADVDIRGDDGSTALQVASYYENNSAVMGALIEHNANINVLNKDGMTALMLATTKGHLDLVQTLIRGGADIDKQHPETGWTAIFFAVKSGTVNIFKELLFKGAKTEIEGRNVADVASIFRSGGTITAELKKFEQDRKISSHVPILEQSDPVTTGHKVKVSSDEGEHQQEPTQEEKTTELSDLGTPIDKPTPQPTIESDQGSVPTPVTSGKTTEHTQTTLSTEPEQKSYAKKVTKDIKRESQIIDLVLMQFANRLKNICLSDFNEADIIQPQKGVASTEDFTHKVLYLQSR